MTTKFSRRRFAQLSMLTVAASRLAAQSAILPPARVRRVGFAVVGLGTISNIFMEACAQSRGARVAGLVTGHPREKGLRYAAQYNVPDSSIDTYESFDRIRDNQNIEAVYIGLPNAMHCQYTILAAQAGKHVLCEKPMAISSAECRRMIDACKASRVKLMIAYRVHYDPTYARVAGLIRSGALGEIQSFEGAFPGQQPAGAWRLNRKLSGGGSLFDLGIYPLNAVRYFTGAEPTGFEATVTPLEPGTRFADVEETVQWTMQMPGGVVAKCSSSYGQSGENFLTVRGSKGFVTIHNAYSYDGLSLSGKTADGPLDETAAGKKPYQFVAEADYFADCIRNNVEPKTDGEEGLLDLVAIEAIYKAAGAPVA